MLASPVAQLVTNLPANAGGSIPGSRRFPGEGNGNPLQYSRLENSMDRGAWLATVHGGHIESDKTEYTCIVPFNRSLLAICFIYSSVCKLFPTS